MTHRQAEEFLRTILRSQLSLFTPFTSVIDKMRTGRILIAHWSRGRYNWRHKLPLAEGGAYLRIVEYLPRAAFAEVIAQISGEYPQEEGY